MRNVGISFVFGIYPFGNVGDCGGVCGRQSTYPILRKPGGIDLCGRHVFYSKYRHGFASSLCDDIGALYECAAYIYGPKRRHTAFFGGGDIHYFFDNSKYFYTFSHLKHPLFIIKMN
jgi:hypothetical protein